MSTTQKRALGKGLDALLGPRPTAPRAVAPPAPVGQPLEIAVEAIERNPYQTRTQFDEVKLAELTASVAASGVVQPIVVRPLVDGRYQLIAGERRWLASQRAGKATVPAIVREASDAQTMELTVIENLQRADLNPMEQARAYQRLSGEFHLTQEQMAQRTGKDRASVSNFLRLLKLPEALQAMVESGDLSFGHARALLGLPTAEQQTLAAQRILQLHLSVRATENMITGMLHPETREKVAKPEPQQDPNVREAQDKLRRALGLKVTIEDKQGKGRVIIEYKGLEEFDALLESLG